MSCGRCELVLFEGTPLLSCVVTLHRHGRFFIVFLFVFSFCFQSRLALSVVHPLRSWIRSLRDKPRGTCEARFFAVVNWSEPQVYSRCVGRPGGVWVGGGGVLICRFPAGILVRYFEAVDSTALSIDSRNTRCWYYRWIPLRPMVDVACGVPCRSRGARAKPSPRLGGRPRPTSFVLPQHCLVTHVLSLPSTQARVCVISEHECARPFLFRPCCLFPLFFLCFLVFLFPFPLLGSFFLFWLVAFVLVFYF